MKAECPYASPREVTDLGECLFYHTTDIPGHGTVRGPWDLRGGIGRYLGGVSFAGKRILDVGAASGFLSFHMERQGGEVVSYDLCDLHSWDHVPFAGTDVAATAAISRLGIRNINNSYWYCHRVYGSKNRVVYGTVYNIPESIGPVDIGVFGSILLHLRDPFLALQTGLSLVRDTVIVADVIPRRRFWQRFLTPFLRPEMTFLPDPRKLSHGDTWWILPPQLVRRFLEVLGFEDTRMTYHWQPFNGRRRFLYTIVGRRTKPAVLLKPPPVPRAA